MPAAASSSHSELGLGHLHESSESSSFSIVSPSELEGHNSDRDTLIRAPSPQRYIMGGGDSAPPVAGLSTPFLAPKPVGQWISPIYRERLEQFYTGGQWEKFNLLGVSETHPVGAGSS